MRNCPMLYLLALPDPAFLVEDTNLSHVQFNVCDI